MVIDSVVRLAGSHACRCNLAPSLEGVIAERVRMMRGVKVATLNSTPLAEAQTPPSALMTFRLPDLFRPVPTHQSWRRRYEERLPDQFRAR
jgi:hypothetical protein